MLANEATGKSQIDTMKRLKDLPSREIRFDLAEVLLGNLQTKVNMQISELQFYNSKLNSISAGSLEIST